MWNDIGEELHNCVSLSTFNKKLMSLIRPQKRETFGIDNPSGIHNIFRLRVGLSQLKHHKKKHNFVDTPSAICDCQEEGEDCTHFFLNCVLYVTHRATLLNCATDIFGKYNLTEQAINVNVLLYGHQKLTLEDNRLILQATIRFIDDTGCFS